MTHLSRNGFGTHVSRETIERLEVLEGLVLKWSPRINLVSHSNRDKVWRRHILDSSQIWEYGNREALSWVDIGSGGGFPGLVVAALGAQDAPRLVFTLVESDHRKAVFLTEAIREMSVNANVRTSRVEDLEPLGADVVSARAVASLDRLLSYYERHRSPDGVGLFPKGQSVHKEIVEARKNWSFEFRVHKNKIEADAAIIEVGAVSRVTKPESTRPCDC